MPKVHRTHHTRLDSLSVGPYDVKTLFGINIGPLEMVLHFFPRDFWGVKIRPGWKASLGGENPTWELSNGPNHIPIHGNSHIRTIFALSSDLFRVAGFQTWLFLGKHMGQILQDGGKWLFYVKFLKKVKPLCDLT